MVIKKILIVDDSPTERHFLGELLSKNGYQVVTLESGEEAVARVAEVMPDLIVMDVVMPGMNGFQATRTITRNEATKHIPVIMCTSKNQETDIVWAKRRIDGGPDGRGVGFYFRNVTELVLFGVRGKNARNLAPGRSQVNFLATQKREHSRKPDEFYEIVESCSPGPRLEMFARGARPGWDVWGNQATEEYFPDWPTYSNHSQAERINGRAMSDLVAVPAK